MQNVEQNFYIKYDVNDGYVLGQLTQKGYDALSDDDKKNYTHVIVDQAHLNGWGKYRFTVRSVNGVLSYPDNWPKDQSQQINDLKKQLQDLSSNNTNLSNQLNDANSKIADASQDISKSTDKIKELGQLSMTLQSQLSKSSAQSAGYDKKISQLGRLAMQLQMQLAKTNNKSNNK